MDVFLQQLFNGFSLGSILLLVALGLAFSFGLMNVINMAHGEMIMVGAYSAYVAENWFEDLMGSSGFEYYFFFALAMAFVVAQLLVVYCRTTVPAAPKLVLAAHSSRPVCISVPPSLKDIANSQSFVLLLLASAVPPYSPTFTRPPLGSGSSPMLVDRPPKSMAGL